MLDTIVDFTKSPKSIEEKINLKSFLFIISELKPNYDLKIYLNELLKIHIINDELYIKIVSYLTI